ncbi:MAG TPA: DUF4105 domain-containing protein [Limnobacter sp.]
MLVLLLLPLLAFALWWITQKPSHQRDWADDVSQLLQWEQQGSVVTLTNVRHFDWRSEADYTPRWETRQYNLDSLESADLVLSYWMGPHIAHTLVSFGFDDGRHLVFSLEIRKERGEAFSAVAGFFRQYESVLIASEEDDILRTRTNTRGEDVYLYRLAIPREQLRTLFMAYLDKARDIEQHPQFYNTLTSNCTTIVIDIARRIAPGLPMDYRLLASGHFAEYAYDQGGLVAGYDFDTLHRLGRITDRAQSVSPNDNFSVLIREGVPTPGHNSNNNGRRRP